jgi:hypothetical protein
MHAKIILKSRKDLATFSILSLNMINTKFVSWSNLTQPMGNTNIGPLRDSITMSLCSLFTRLKIVKKHVMNFFFQIENKHKHMVVDPNTS